MSNRRDIQFLYNPHNKATLLDCSFTVAAADSAGLGITGLNKSGRIASVYMHTSATPATGNPNPASGYILVNLQDNYNTFLGGFQQIQSPLSGSDTGSLTANVVYQITVLGTTTQAQWVTAGLPVNIAAAVGVTFVAAATASITGTGKVEVIKSTGAGMGHISVFGNPTVMNTKIGQLGGMSINYACWSTNTVTAPADGTIIRLGIYLNNSAQGV